MTIEQKKEALRNAASKELSSVYDLYKWKKVTGSENLFVLSGECGSEVRKAYLAGCEDAWGGEIFIDYNPAEDIVGIYIKDRPIQEKFKDDLMVLVEKYAPFKMQLSFDKDLSPLLSRTEKVEPQNFSKFFKEFKKEYDENFPLFYMISVSAKEWYDGFSIRETYCVDGVYY